MSSYGTTNYGSITNNAQVHQDLSSYASVPSYTSSSGLQIGLNQKLNNGNVQTSFIQPVSISEHVEITKPVVVPIVKNIGKIIQTIYTVKNKLNNKIFQQIINYFKFKKMLI